MLVHQTVRGCVILYAAESLSTLSCEMLCDLVGYSKHFTTFLLKNASHFLYCIKRYGIGQHRAPDITAYQIRKCVLYIVWIAQQGKENARFEYQLSLNMMKLKSLALNQKVNKEKKQVK